MSDWHTRLQEAEEMYQSRSADLYDAESNLDELNNEIQVLEKKVKEMEDSHKKVSTKLKGELKAAEDAHNEALATKESYEKQKVTLEENYQSLFRKATNVKEREHAVEALEDKQRKDLEVRIAFTESEEKKTL
eukprot:PhF_6_TR13571/c0_g1_i2/m.21701